MVLGRSVAVLCVLAMGTVTAGAQDGAGGWFSGDWYLKVGATVLHAPKFSGAKNRSFAFQPIIAVGKHGPSARFTSRNDAISLALFDTGTIRAGAAGKLVMPRNEDTHSSLAGLSEVKLGGEAGVFAEVYPTDFMRIRAEVRHGIRSHSGVVADISADAFFDLTDQIQISAGPRASWASQDYFDAWYGVNAAEAAASGLSEYAPGSGMKGAGFGGAVTWNVTDQLSASIFAEYERLMGPAAASSLVRERGSRHQVTIGASSVYRFDWSM